MATTAVKMGTQVMDRLLEAADLVHRHRELEFNKLGTTPATVAVLKQLRRADLNERRICEAVRREPHTMVGLLVRMQKRGLITKQRNGNAMRVSITLAGQELLNLVDTIDGRLPYFDYLDEERRQGLLLCLGRVIERTRELL